MDGTPTVTRPAQSDGFYETPEWLLGDGAQKRWARAVAKNGRVVLPTYGMDDVDSSTKAPVLFFNDELLIAPDILLLGGGKPPAWNDVKAKSIPTWRICKPGPRWEHGIDYACLTEYERVQSESGHRVYIVIHETRSPSNPLAKSELIESDTWLYMSIDDIRRSGDRRPDWPGGKLDKRRRGRKRLGGWLWDRRDMRLVRPPTEK